MNMAVLTECKQKINAEVKAFSGEELIDGCTNEFQRGIKY